MYALLGIRADSESGRFIRGTGKFSSRKGTPKGSDAAGCARIRRLGALKSCRRSMPSPLNEVLPPIICATSSVGPVHDIVAPEQRKNINLSGQLRPSGNPVFTSNSNNLALSFLTVRR